MGGRDGAGFVLYSYLPGGTKLALADVLPGGDLDLSTVPKYLTPLLIPPVMPRAATITLPGGKPADYYEISVRQFEQQILPAGFGATTVWGYGPMASRSRRGLLVHNAPSLTIEATHDRPVRVKWVNELVDADGDYRPHLLPVDPTLHWANPPGGAAGRDSRPHSTPRQGHTPGRSRWSLTCTAPSGWVMRATGTPRPGTCPPQPTSRPDTPRRAPGTTSSPARRPPSTARHGGRGSPPSSTRTRTAQGPSGTTTTRWA